MRMGHLSAFYQRIIEWDYPDVPARAPVYSSDRPIKDKPLRSGPSTHLDGI